MWKKNKCVFSHSSNFPVGGSKMIHLTFFIQTLGARDSDLDTINCLWRSCSQAFQRYHSMFGFFSRKKPKWTTWTHPLPNKHNIGIIIIIFLSGVFSRVVALSSYGHFIAENIVIKRWKGVSLARQYKYSFMYVAARLAVCCAHAQSTCVSAVLYVKCKFVVATHVSAKHTHTHTHISICNVLHASGMEANKNRRNSNSIVLSFLVPYSFSLFVRTIYGN